MSNQDILKLESNRLNNLNMIYLIPDQNGWLKAYEWSAFLLEFYPLSKSDKPLKPVKKNVSSIGDIVYVSFPQKSFEKYAAGLSINIQEDARLYPVITDLSAYEQHPDIATYQQILEQWKNTISIQQPAQKQKSSTDYSKVYKSSEIEQKILGFQYYNLEKEDLIDFINQLKNMCATRI